MYRIRNIVKAAKRDDLLLGGYCYINIFMIKFYKTKRK